MAANSIEPERMTTIPATREDDAGRDRRGVPRRRGRSVDRRAGVQRGRRPAAVSRAAGRGGTRAAPHARARQPKWSMSTTAAATTRSRSARALPAEALDVQIVSLSRNFGKEAALMAGLDCARFGAVLFMDGDGQHPPDLLTRLVGHWLDDGYDVVFTAKAHRENEGLLRRFGVKMFYALINWGARQKIPVDAGDFRLLSPRAADALRRLPERNRFFKGLASWIGFRQLRVDYEPAERKHGRYQLERHRPDRIVDRRAHVVLGRAAAPCEPARRAACGRRR